MSIIIFVKEKTRQWISNILVAAEKLTELTPDLVVIAKQKITKRTFKATILHATTKSTILLRSLRQNNTFWVSILLSSDLLIWRGGSKAKLLVVPKLKQSQS